MFVTREKHYYHLPYAVTCGVAIFLQLSSLSSCINTTVSPADVINSTTSASPVLIGNYTSGRNSRQLISLLKNFLQEQPWLNQQQQQPGGQSLNHQHYSPSPGSQFSQPQQETSQYNQRPSFFPQSQQAENKIQYVGSGSSNDGGVQTNPYDNSIHQQPQQQQQYQYPMLNYPSNQHTSVPLYQETVQAMAQYQHQQPQFQHQQGSEYRPQYQKEDSSIPGGASGFGGGLVGSLLSAAFKNPNRMSSSISNGNQMLAKLGLPGIPEDLDLSVLLNLANFGNFEGMLNRVNQFDKLQCIPRMICQMVARRKEDEALRDSTSTTTSTTTTTTTPRPKKNKKKGSSRRDSARFIKFKGVDTALDQFIKFLDVMQMKDWSLYPYIKGMYEGNQVMKASDCANRFHTCPFSEDQLVYYFNNYNGGFFQSVRSGRDLVLDNVTSNFNTTTTNVNSTFLSK